MIRSEDLQGDLVVSGQSVHLAEDSGAVRDRRTLWPHVPIVSLSREGACQEGRRQADRGNVEADADGDSEGATVDQGNVGAETGAGCGTRACTKSSIKSIDTDDPLGDL